MLPKRSLHHVLMGPDMHVWHVQLEEDFVKANPEWVAELEIMVQSKVKAEIQALSSFGFQYLSQVYLPLKLQEGDWI
jgi:meiotic recombination protein SPO11